MNSMLKCSHTNRSIGRAQGIGYVQEMLARLQHLYITSSNSSVNSSLDNNPATFPLDQAFYADFSHVSFGYQKAPERYPLT